MESGGQVSSPGDIYDATGRLVVAGANFGSGANGSLVTSDANGSLSLQPPAGLPSAGGMMTGPLVTQVPNIVFDGDSLTIGAGALPFNMFPNGGDYPSQVVSALDPRGTYANIGIGGETAAQMLANAPTAVDPLIVPGANNIVVFCGGSNDIWASDVNPYSVIVAYCQARRAAGWKVIVGTIGPRNDTLDALPANFETLRLACNASIRANWPAFADGIADWGNDPVIGATSPNGPANDLRYYNGDGAHLTTKGYAIRARYALAALSKLGVNGSYRRNTAPQQADIWIPANQLYVIKGTPALGIIPGTVIQGWTMPHGSDTEVMGDFLAPLDWANFIYAPVYTRTGSASGTVAFAGVIYSMINIYDGYNSAMPAAGTPFVVPAGGIGNVGGLTYSSTAYFYSAQSPPAANAVSAPTLYTGYACTGQYPRMAQKPSVQRTGTDSVNDTCTDPIYLLGIYAYRIQDA